MNYTHLEIATEIAWQVGDTLTNAPRAESRWICADIAKRVIEARIITEDSEDIDEIIGAWLIEEGYTK